MQKLISKTVFANPRVISDRANGLVMTGDVFETDTMHARELKLLGFAEDYVEPEPEPEPVVVASTAKRGGKLV